MAKSSGLGDQLYVDGVDLSGDTQSYEVGGGPAPWDVTGIDKSAMERIGVTRDGRLNWVSFFNKDTSQAHLTLRTLPLTDRNITVCRGTTLGNPAASLVAKQVNYDPTRGQDGSLLINLQALANGFGAEWGRQLTAGKRTDGAPANGASVDHTTVTTAFGWQAWLHVFAFAGTSVTVTIQDSADDAAWANLTGGAFTAATGVTTQRLQGGRTDTVRRYLRVISSGTFSNAVFAVHFTRNDTSVSF